MQILPLSVLIPTPNEARNIADCLETAGFAHRRIVFASYSPTTPKATKYRDQIVR